MKNQNKKKNWVIFLLMCLFATQSCKDKKYQGEDNSLKTIRNANNKITYKRSSLDSLQAINVITSQKIQDLLDLSTLYISGNKDTEIDSVIYTQMQAHFLNKDSSNLKPLLKEMDSLRVRFVKVNNLKISKSIVEKDTLDLANFDVDYYDNKRTYITSVNRDAQYFLKPSPVKFQKEFKFYFNQFYKKTDSTKTKSKSNK